LLTELDQQLKVAEARLSGGVSVVLRPRKPVIVHARMDDTEAVDQVDLAIERTLEAERSVHLSIADVLDIEVTVGDVNQRKAVERLRARSKKEIAPALKKAGVRTLNEVVNALAAIAREATAAEGLRKQAMDLRGDAARLFDRAAQETVHASAFARTSDELDARKAAIGDSAPAILEERLAALGRNWEAPAEAWHARKAKEHRTAEGEFAAAEQSAKLAEYKVSEADRRTTEAAAKRDAAVAIAQSSDPASLLISIERELASFGHRQADVAAKLSALANAAGNEVDKAQRALQAAEQRMVSTKQAHAGAIETLDASRARLNTRTGEINLRRALRETKDRAGAAALFEQCARELAGLPFESGGTEADLAAADRELADARRELDSAKEDLHKSEGALSKVGGMAAREDVERIEEALTAERAREREIETDADAWKLLRDTLREVENEEGAHLGRALAAPVSKKFEELTSGRYADLRFDAMLKAEAVGLRDSPSAASEVLSALSVGTRNQLATLIRLTIAAQLKSAIVLDDHLVHTDPVRLAWFQEVLMKTAVNTQVVVLTCRPEDYLTRNHLAVESPERDVAGGTVRAIDVARAVKRWAVIPSRPPKTMPGE
jgi:hypothetical protein